jgi:hypothetical protein
MARFCPGICRCGRLRHRRVRDACAGAIARARRRACFLIDKHVAAGLNCASCHSESPPAKQPGAAVCTKCHGGYQDLAAKTAADQPNPHASHLGDIPCESCHRIHQASVIYCAQCHNFDFKTP